MIYPELRQIHSPDLEPPSMPDDPADCEVFFRVLVGPKGGDGEETFTFTVVTHRRLARSSGSFWGRGALIVPAFEWPLVIESVAMLLAQCTRPTWSEVAAELNRSLDWQIDGGGTPDA